MSPLLRRISAGMLALSLLPTPLFAKIYPDDFLPGTPPPLLGRVSPSHTASVRLEEMQQTGNDMMMKTNSGNEMMNNVDTGTMMPVTAPMQPTPDASRGLSRSDFIDAIANRLYDADAHSNCLAALGFSETYSLLYRDVPVDAPYATSVCLAIRSGVMRGDHTGNFRPEDRITAAEAAQVLARIFLNVPPAKSTEAWYAPAMQAIRSVDREFTLEPGDVVTGNQLNHTLCTLAAADGGTGMMMGECQ